jgi:ribonuclease P protein component
MHRMRNQDIYSVLRKGRRFSFPLFRFTIRKNAYPYARFAYVAPRTVDKRAVVRNLLRRRVREWIRKQPQLLQQSTDIVITFTQAAARTPRKQFYEELKSAFQKITHP